MFERNVQASRIIGLTAELQAEGTIFGSGITNYLPKFTPDGQTLGASLIYDDGTNLTIKANTSPEQDIATFNLDGLTIVGTKSIKSSSSAIQIDLDYGGGGNRLLISTDSGADANGTYIRMQHGVLGDTEMAFYDGLGTGGSVSFNDANGQFNWSNNDALVRILHTSGGALWEYSDTVSTAHPLITFNQTQTKIEWKANAGAEGSTLDLLTDRVTLTAFNSTGYQGLVYGADYSAGYTSRSLVDKEYVDLITGFGLGTNNYVPKFSATGLVDSLIFDNGTNVGIGTASPSAKLHVFGGNVIFQRNATGMDFAIDSDVDSTLRLQQNTTTRYHITATNVADVREYMTAGFLTFITDYQRILNAAGTIEMMYLNGTNGRVGIGTASPLTKFHVVAPIESEGSGTPIAIVESSTGGTRTWFNAQATYANILEFNTGGVLKGKLQVTSASDSYYFSDTFSLRNLAGTFHLHKNASGSIGIGTVTPSAKLHVVGNQFITQEIALNHADTYIVGFTSGPFFVSGDTNTLAITNSQGSNMYYVNGNTNDAAHIFTTIQNGQGTILERLRIRNNGEVRIAGLEDTNSPQTTRAVNVSADGTLVAGDPIGGSLAKYTESTVGLTGGAAYTVNHNLGTTLIQITMWDTTTGEMVLGFAATNRTSNSVDVEVTVSGDYDIIVIG